MSENTEEAAAGEETATDTANGAGELIQPIILRIDKEAPCAQDEGIAAVALAAVAAFLQDPENPAWQAWASGHFGKSVRRANPAMFDRVCREFPDHVLIEVGGARAAGLAPLPAGNLPKRLAKLQVSGTQLPASDEVLGGRVQVVLDESLGMSTGKACAQGAHALFAWLLQADQTVVQQWLDDGAGLGISWVGHAEFTSGARQADGPVIQDAGRTEIDPGSTTAYVRLTG